MSLKLRTKVTVLDSPSGKSSREFSLAARMESSFLPQFHDLERSKRRIRRISLFVSCLEEISLVLAASATIICCVERFHLRSLT